MLNGLVLEVPETGFAFVGFELVAISGVVMPRARELHGAMAPRYGVMRFGEPQLQNIMQQSAMVGGMDVPFTFSFNRPRPKTSVN